MPAVIEGGSPEEFPSCAGTGFGHHGGMRNLILPLIFAAAANAPADDFPSGAIETARESAVHVFGNQRTKGGGVVVDRDGLVLTACHLADGTNMTFSVEYPNGRRTPVSVLAVDVQADLMLLTPTVAVTDAVPAVFARRELEEGHEGICVGPALWEPFVTSYGRVASNEPRYREFGKLGYCSRFRLFSAMTPQLFSGSPWFTREGRLAGIQSGYLNNLGGSGEMSGLAMVACVDDMKRLVASRKDAATPDLGAIVYELWSADSAHIAGFPPDSEGVLITKLDKGGAMDRAGLHNLDLIQSLDERPVRTRRDFFNALRLTGPGNEVRVKYRRLNTAEPLELALKFGDLETAWWARKYPAGALKAP